MPASPDHQHHVRRVVLPSGKTVEVVYFEDPAASRPAQPALHVCGACGSHLVHPVEWEEAGPEHWEVTLRCPNCERETRGVHSQEVVERFDAHLDEGTEAVVRDLRRLVHANMEDEIERWVAALAANLIIPEDF